MGAEASRPVDTPINAEANHPVEIPVSHTIETRPINAEGKEVTIVSDESGTPYRVITKMPAYSEIAEYDTMLLDDNMMLETQRMRTGDVVETHRNRQGKAVGGPDGKPSQTGYYDWGTMCAWRNANGELHSPRDADGMALPAVVHARTDGTVFFKQFFDNGIEIEEIM